MIRTIFRCAKFQKVLFTSESNYTIHVKNYVTLSVYSAGRRRRNTHMDQDLTVKELTNEGPFDVHDSEEVKVFVKLLRKRLKCPAKQVAEFVAAHPELWRNKSNVAENVELYHDAGVRSNVVFNNPEMLLLTKRQITTNLQIIREMKPKNINDFAPLVQVPTAKLSKLKKRAENEEDVVPHKHRIYYLSDAMKVDPPTIATFVSKRLFVLYGSFESMVDILQTLLKYVSPVNILHDLWAFTYSSNAIEKRLSEAKDGDKKKLMPWMIRCQEHKLLKSIRNSVEEKAILGNQTSVEYLSNRLKFDVRTTNTIMSRHPASFNVKVTKMKEILDFLFDAGFTPLDISQTPRIFCHSLDTTRKRLDELKSIGCRPQSLVILCKSAKEYQKFVTSWKSVRERLAEKNNVEE